MDLQVTERTQFGKSSKNLRKTGLIPAEFYGRGMQNLHVSVGGVEFKKLFREAGENTVINLLVNNVRKPALITDVERDRISGEITHVDFYGVHMDEKIKARVPLEFVGESPAVKEKEGVLNQTMNDIEIEALPGDLPQSFIVDLTKLVDLNQSIYVKDLTIPQEVKVLIDHETVIVSVAEKKAEEEIPVAPVDVSTVKVEAEEKVKERAAEKAEGESASAA